MSPMHATVSSKQSLRSALRAWRVLLWLALCGIVTTSQAQSLPGSGRGLLSAPTQSFLAVDEAFRWYTSLPQPGVIGVHWQIVSGHYLYKDKFVFLMRTHAGEQALTAEFPLASAHEDEFFGAVDVYFSDMSVLLRLPQGLTAGPITLIIEYQGCAEAGLCYTPQRREIALEL
jgi:thiol:disulfide interchange protein DsbD